MQTRRKDHHSWRKFKSALISGLTFCSAVLVIAPLGLVFFHVLKSGVGAVNLDFFTHLPKPVGEVDHWNSRRRAWGSFSG